MSKPASDLDRLDLMLSKLEKLGKLLLWALGLIITGAVWAALLQSDVASLKAEQAEIKPKVEMHSQAIANIEGRLHGISSQVGKMPGKVTAKLNEPLNE